jgi:cell division protein FtsB
VEQLKIRRGPVLLHFLNRFLTVLIVVGGLLLAALAFYPQWVYREQLAERLKDDQAKLRAEQLLQKKSEREVVLLQNDPGYIEAIARDKLGMMKDGETIFRLDGSRAQPSATSSPAAAPAPAAATAVPKTKPQAKKK